MRSRSPWERVAQRDPGKAVELYAKLAEFILPKLARTEVKEEPREEPQLIQIRFVPPPDRTDK